MIAFRAEHARWPTDAEITTMTATVSAPAPTMDRKTRQVIDFVQTLEAGLAAAGLSEGEAAVLREAALMGFGWAFPAGPSSAVRADEKRVYWTRKLGAS